MIVGLPERLTRLADRLDRLRPLNHQPEAYFLERDEIRRSLMELAAELRRPRSVPAPRGRFEPGAFAVNGRVIQAERRGFRKAAG